MAEVVKYKVVRLQGPENQLEQQLDDHGAGLWELSTLLRDPQEGVDPYLCIFQRRQQVQV